ncbi:MAG: hypothetical protein LBP87_04625 [Planctomycetaceae bacterium]|nr:hypothetical protein [Planctomycetaceae bacterium]
MKRQNNVAIMSNAVSLILTINILVFVLGCDLAKPLNKKTNSETTTSTVTEDTQPVKDENNVQPANEIDNVQPAKEVVQNKTDDTSIKLDQTFEDKEYGFRFNYPGTCPLEVGEGIIGMGKLTLYFSKQKVDQEMIALRVIWMTNEQLLSKTKTQITKDIKGAGGSLKLFEKIKIDNQDCLHIRVSFGGVFGIDSRVSEQYFLALKQGDLTINFSAPANKFETYRPQFTAILNSFKIDK